MMGIDQPIKLRLEIILRLNSQSIMELRVVDVVRNLYKDIGSIAFNVKLTCARLAIIIILSPIPF